MEVPYLNLGLAALIHFAIGMIWYGPLFGKLWLKLSGISQKDIGRSKNQGMTGKFAISLINSIVVSYVLYLVLTWTSTTDIASALTKAAWLWFGFNAPVLVGSVLWENKPVALFVLNTSYWLVSFLAITSVLISL